MFDFLNRTIENDRIRTQQRVYGVYDENQVIHLEQVSNIDENPEAIMLSSEGKTYPVKLTELQDAIKKCRNHLVFPQRTTLPFKTHQNPLIYFRVLKNVSDIQDLVDNPQAAKVDYIPNAQNQYHADLRCIEYFGHKVPVSDVLHNYISNGSKIAIKVDKNGDLVWLTSYEESALSAWEEKVRLYQTQMDDVHKILETAKSFNTEKRTDNGILQNLPYDVILGYKVNLSGLSASSAGNGVKRNTVIHLMPLHKPFHEYTTIEEMYSTTPICGPQKGRHFGMQVYYSQKLNAETLEDTGITCKSCLSKLRKMLRNNGETAY